MESIVISVPNGEVKVPDVTRNSKSSIISAMALVSISGNCDMRKVVHSVKVGAALVIVSLLCLLDPLYKKFGSNTIWAVITVVVIFEFSAGATLSKGLNRGAGTVLGGLFGCIAAGLAHEIGRVDSSIVTSACIFTFGAAATYIRLLPSIKKKYDYGVMIFILTFSLIAVSGIRVEEVAELACDRLSTVAIGFAVCIFTSLLVYPMWASDELHGNLASEFDALACCIEGLFEDHFKLSSQKEYQQSTSMGSCKAVLYSKPKDESLANYARWEPWHGRFGISYPWEKYLQIGELLRELAAVNLSLRSCNQEAERIISPNFEHLIREPCVTVGSTVAWTLRELGESVMKMRRCRAQALLKPKLQTVKHDLSQVKSQLKTEEMENHDGFQTASFVFLAMHMVDKMVLLTKEVDELGELAQFSAK